MSLTILFLSKLVVFVMNKQQSGPYLMWIVKVCSVRLGSVIHLKVPDWISSAPVSRIGRLSSAHALIMAALLSPITAHQSQFAQRSGGGESYEDLIKYVST